MSSAGNSKQTPFMGGAGKNGDLIALADYESRYDEPEHGSAWDHVQDLEERLHQEAEAHRDDWIYNRYSRMNDVISRPVLRFLIEIGTYETCREGAWQVHHLLRGRMGRYASGQTLEIVYNAAIYTELPLPDGHDVPEVREFVQQCQDAVARYEEWEAEREHERQAHQKLDQVRERLGVSAGQAEVSSNNEASTAGQNALTCKNDLKHKLDAEGHKDPRSQDWKDAPRSAWTTYEWFMKVLIGGGHVCEIPSNLDPDGRGLAWLMSEGLIVRVDGELLALPDPEPEYDPDERYMHWGGKEIDLWEYPGWTKEMGNPLAGKTWGRDLDEHVRALVLREKAQGRDLSSRQIAQKLQTSVDRGEHRAISHKAVQRALKRLVDEGELVQVTYADRFRKDHRWVNIPATYADPAERLTLRSVRERLRQRRERELDQYERKAA